ncbi:MAG: LysM peptidoglycan-binding domain-containing protein [Chthoniobacterales bacterium]
MKIPKLIVRKKLRATTARRSLTGEMDYEEMSEPNMKLSRALLIVLVLHVVAVAGIIAFNTIKSRQGAFPPPSVSAIPAKPAATTAPTKTDAVPLASAAKATTAKEETNIPKAQPVNSEGGNFYTVVKGDNPVKIAKKLKVTESDLLLVNHIDDPRKLQIGQKLIVPKSNKSKKN